MIRSERRDLGRWAGLVAACILLVLCFSFLGSLSAAADREPVLPPPLPPGATTAGMTVLADQNSTVRNLELEEQPRLAPPYQRLTGSGPLTLGPGSSALNALLLAPPLPGSANLAICLTTERVWGLVGAGETATVTVRGSQMGAALADANGFFWTTLYDSAGDRPGLASGDAVAIYHDGSLASSLNLRSISAAVDVVADTVSGSIGGSGLPIDVTVYAGFFGHEPSRATYSRTVSTNGSGEFTVEFSGDWDLAADDAVVVAYLEDGVEVHQRFHGPRLAVLPFPFGIVAGWTTPGTVVTGTVYSDLVGPTIRDQKTLTTGADGRYDFSGPDTGLDLNEGDVVVVEIEGGPVLTRSVDHITPPEVDTANDRVVGEVEAGAVVHGRATSLTSVGYQDVYTTATADAGGVYTLEFGALVDLMPGYWGGGYVEDDEGDALMLWAPSPSVEVHQTWDEVRGRAPAPPGPLSIGHAVTLTVNHDGLETSFVKGMDWYGDYYFSPEDGLPDIGPGDVITVESEGYTWQGVVQVQAMSAAHDPDLDQIAGTVELPSSRVEIYASQWMHWSDSMPMYPVGGQVDTLTTASSPFAVTLEGFDVRNATQYDAGHRTGDSYLEMIYNSVDYVRVWPWYGAVAAHLGPSGTPYTFTLRTGDGTLKAEATGTSGEPTGWIDYWWVSDVGVEIVPGDRVQVESEQGFSQTVVIPDLSLSMEETEDVVSGSAPSNSLLYVQVDNHGAGFVPVGADGDFAVSAGQLQNMWGDGDLGWGDNGFFCYLDENANQVCRGYDWPHIFAHIGPNSGGDRQVRGYGAAPNATILVTVTTDPGALVATTATDSDAYGNYGTGDQLPQGSLELWNDVTVDFANGMTDTLTIYPVGGEADPDTDVITVTAAGPPFFSIGLQYCDGDWCDWIDMGPIGESGVITVNLAAERGFDVQAGTHYDAYLSVWNSHEVVYSWLLPIADLWIEKETTPGHAIPGGTYLYKIRYGNGGTGTTESTVITDILPANTAFQADTSGFPVVSDGGVVTWTLDPVPPGSDEEFFVALSVDGSVPTESDLDPNCVSISAASPPERDPGDNHRCSEGAWVTEGDRGIWVDKWPAFEDPHPGQLFFYEIDYGSDGGGATGPVWLTDTLPAGTEFVRWEEENDWGALWTEVITTGGQFVLHAPAGIPGDMGGRIRLALHLEPGAEISTTLENLVEVVTPNDVNPENNWDSDDSAHVSPPRHDMSMEKDSNGGVLVPGGEVWFHIRYENRGNIDAQAWLTDTLPAGTSYQAGSASYGGGGWGWFPFEPAEVTDDLVVWDLGVVEVGQSVDFDFALDIDLSASLGDLENCAEVGVDGTETTPGDNADCVVETLYPPSPNLRVHKWHDWNGDGQLNYRVHFQNIGSEPVSNVWITDILPLGTYWDGWWELGFDWERLVTWDYVDGARTFLWNFDEMWPGDSGWLWFNANLDEPGSPLRLYTNTVEITLPPGDPSPTDNYDETVAFSGGELRRVEFWLNETGPSSMWGEAVPGSAITVTTPVTQVYAWADPECGGCWNIDNADVLEPGDLVEVVAGEGLLPVTVTIPAPFSAEVDTVADTVFGQIGDWSERPVEIHGDWPGGYREIASDASGNYLASFADIPPGGSGYVRILDEVSYAQVIYHRPFYALELILEINYDHDWVEGNYEAGHTVWITVTESDGTSVKGTAELLTGWLPDRDRPGFSTGWQGWSEPAPDLQPGDRVYGRVDNGYTASVRIGEISGNVDPDDDSIAGSVLAEWLEVDTVDVECHPWGAPGEGTPNKGSSADPRDGDPGYYCQWNPETEWDVMNGQQIGVAYQEPEGHTVFAVFQGPWMRVNYTQDSIGGDYPAGHTMTVTVSHTGHWFVKGLAVVETRPWDGWNGPGFSIEHDDWISLPPDIVPFDRIQFSSSDGYSHTVEVGIINGAVYAAQDRAAGWLSVPWWEGVVPELPVECHPWGGPNEAPGKESNAPPDGSSPWDCQWDPNSEWDIQPGQDVAVMYVEPDDADRVIAVVSEPAPDLRVEKWVEGNGEVQYDGLSTFGIRIRNEGEAPADQVVLTDTIPADTSYLADSSGVSPASVGDSLVWTFDAEPLAPGDQLEFLLVLQNGLTEPGPQLDNQVWVWAEHDSNPDNNYAQAGVQAADLEPPDLYVHKDPAPGDPAPGSTFVYEIGYGNGGPAATGPVVLTDTIPTGTSIVGWYSSNGYTLWNDVSTADQLILEAPVLPGYWEDRIVLRLAVDPGLQPGTQLTNTVELESPDGYAWDMRDDVNVGEPRWDVGISKDYGGGILVPGGWAEYHIGIHNQGNMTATVRLTDTVRPGAAYAVESWCHDGEQPFECSFTSSGVSQVTWEFDEIPPGGHFDVGVRWNIYPDSTPGIEFGNCVEISADADEWPFDNVACAEPQTIREWGPNLRVRKDHEWQNEGTVLHYGITVENIGTARLENVWITDVYPAGTSFNDDWWPSHGPWITLTHNALNRELVFWAQQFDPGDSAYINVRVNLDDPDLVPAWYTNTVEAPVDGDVFPADNSWLDLAVKTEVERVELWVSPEPAPSWMWGDALPGSVVTVTTPHTQVTTIAGHPDCPTCWEINDVGLLLPGDPVTVEAGAGLLPVLLSVPNPFDVAVDTAADEVSGQIDHLDRYPVQVHGNWDGGLQAVETDAIGRFSALYDDIPRGVDGYIRFEDEADYAWIVWHRPFATLDLVLEVNYGHDWVQGSYEPDHTVWITVTESDGVTVKGTAELQSQEVPQWGDFVGFSTNLDDPWDGEAPDMHPGDWVYGRVDNGYASEVKIGDITGAINTTADTIAGTVTAPWPPGTLLDAWCSVWVENGPRQDFTVDAAGDPYFCDFTEEWDLQPGQDVAVGYMEPDQDQVMNVFREPAPDMNAGKWVEGNSLVQYNGLTVFHIRLRNEGDADAVPVIVTDTLPAGMTYLANSSGLEPDIQGESLVWTFGSIGWAESLDFELVVSNDLAIGETVTNRVEVWTEFDSDPGDNQAEAEVQAVDNPGVDLYIGKNPQPGDPAPGQTFLYEIGYGNNGPAATGPVTLTDTIPDGTSIVEAYSENGYGLWTDVSTSDQLILVAPALPGNWGDRIFLRLRVDPFVEAGTQLTNTVEIVSPDGAAQETRDDVWVGEPRWDGFLDKEVGWGTLVPGEVVAYNLHVRNGGNMAASFRVTDTLPAGTSFWQLWRGDAMGSVEVDPTYVDSEILVVDLGEMEPAEWLNLELRLKIDPGVGPGTDFENCAELSPAGPGDPLGDNEDCVVEAVHGEGPNVRIVKDYQWNGEGQIQYNLTFWNLGTETLYDVEIIDTLPAGTQWVDEWWHNFWEGIDARVEGDQVIFTVSWLDPTWASSISFNANLDPPLEGQAYVNSVTMPVDGDVFPDDNADQVTAYSGPDLYVEKVLAGGEPRPGAILTYTIEFGNQNRWPWSSDDLGEPPPPSSQIVDTLPQGMVFITATAPWNPDEGWMPDIDGQQLTWGWQPMGAGERWKFDLIAQVSESAAYGDVLTNTVEVMSNSPGDIDPLPDNNYDQVVLDVVAPAFTISKDWNSSRVAGMLVTYTLAVENVGNELATGVSFAETLPDDLTFLDSDGAWDGTDITWNVGALAASGGTAGGWFSAKLTCEADISVINDTYSVTSDQGATAAGASVELTTLEPTIDLTLVSAPDPAIVGQTVTLTATASTDGTDLSYEWNFGAGAVTGGLTETHVWDTEGMYTVVFTATDQCGFSEVVSTTVTVNPSTMYIYLPMVLRNY